LKAINDNETYLMIWSISHHPFKCLYISK